jgi:hypothetical protein
MVTKLLLYYSVYPFFQKINMAYEFATLKSMVIRKPEIWKGHDIEYGKVLYYTLNSLDVFIQKNRIVIEDSDDDN